MPVLDARCGKCAKGTLRLPQTEALNRMSTGSSGSTIFAIDALSIGTATSPPSARHVERKQAVCRCVHHIARHLPEPVAFLAVL